MRTLAKSAANAGVAESEDDIAEAHGGDAHQRFPVVARRDQCADAVSSASRFSRSTLGLRAHLGTRCRASARPSA
jgi:hypothetical protein